eukprot:TRINITY_DN298_c0_g1_i1.p1 TRINITY_DN298_c0_g1~~TRINITY_DN298_c0_g1_i1.p1  ORF type:complete len:199 (+),score=37.41 TRINITY_DN298_c0_g1_i1:2139-2735(+)
MSQISVVHSEDVCSAAYGQAMALNVYSNFLPTTTNDAEAKYIAKIFKSFGKLVRQMFSIDPKGTSTGSLASFWAKLTGESHFSSEYNCAAPSMEVFLKRCLKYDVCGPQELALALIYLKRVKSALNHRTIDKYCIVAVMLACKTLQDSPYNNKSFSTLVKLPVSHINDLELRLLSALEFRTTPSNDDWETYWPVVARV